MRVPAELGLSAALIVAATAGYLVVARAGHPAAGGLVGHGLGIVGFLVMAGGTTTYAWRKRRSGPGAMPRWLQAHVVSGIVGPYLVLLHTGFAFRGVAGASFVLVSVVVISGLVGRFAYTAVPKLRPANGVQAVDAHPDAARAERKRSVLALWWPLHVPLALAMFVLAVVHVLGALYYATLLR